MDTEGVHPHYNMCIRDVNITVRVILHKMRTLFVVEPQR